MVVSRQSFLEGLRKFLMVRVEVLRAPRLLLSRWYCQVEVAKHLEEGTTSS